MDPMKNLVIELVEGKVKEGVDPQEYIKASDSLMTDLSGLDGYIRREVWQGEDGRFVDVIYWDSLEKAQRAAELFPTLPSAKLFESLLDFGSLSMRHLNQIRVYDGLEQTNGKA